VNFLKNNANNKYKNMHENMNYNNKHIISDVNLEDLQDIDVASKNINNKVGMSL